MINPTSDVVNPYEFVNEQCAYLGDIQNCYYIANNLYIKKTFIGCTSVSFGKFIGFFEKIGICMNKSFTTLLGCS